MSSLRAIDLMEVDDLVDFIRGRGFVLDFSDTTFSEFFESELGVNIDHPDYTDRGGSKGKRLRRFLQKVDDKAALKALRALWEYRVTYLRRANQEDPVREAETRYLALISRLGGSPDPDNKRTESAKPKVEPQKVEALLADFTRIMSLEPQPRGYAFEGFLYSLFNVSGLKPRGAFRNCGEQIDGSFVHASETYLLEAKWQDARTGASDLHVFNGKLAEKAAWARGLFVSYSGFTDDGLVALGRAKTFVCMHGYDIYEMLNRKLPFDEVLHRKVRRAAETGAVFVSVRDLFDE